MNGLAISIGIMLVGAINDTTPPSPDIISEAGVILVAENGIDLLIIE